MQDFIDDVKEIVCISGPPMTGKTHACAIKVMDMLSNGWNADKTVVVSISNDIVHNTYTIFKKVIGDKVKKMWFTTISSFYNDILGDMIETCGIIDDITKKTYYNTRGRDISTMHNAARNAIDNNEQARNMLEKAINILVIDSAQYISTEDWVTLSNMKTGSGRKIVSFGTFLGQFPLKNNLLLTDDIRIGLHKVDKAYRVNLEGLKSVNNLIRDWNVSLEKFLPLWKDTSDCKNVSLRIVREHRGLIESGSGKLSSRLHRLIVEDIEKYEAGSIAIVCSNYLKTKGPSRNNTIWYRLMTDFSRAGYKVTDRTEKLNTLDRLAYRIVVTRRIASGVKTVSDDDVHEAAILLSIKNHRNMQRSDIIAKIMNTKRIRGTKTAAELADKILSTSKYPKWIKDKKDEIMTTVSKMRRDFFISRSNPGWIEFVASNMIKWNDYESIFIVDMEDDILNQLRSDLKSISLHPSEFMEGCNEVDVENIMPYQYSCSLVNILCRASSSTTLHVETHENMKLLSEKLVEAKVKNQED